MVSCTKDTLNLTHNFICWSENRHGRFQPCLTSREYYEEKINISMFPKERSLEISKHLLIASIWVHSDSHHCSRFTLYSAHWVLTSTIAFFISTSSLWYPTSFFSYIFTSFYYNVDDFFSILISWSPSSNSVIESSWASKPAVCFAWWLLDAAGDFLGHFEILQVFELNFSGARLWKYRVARVKGLSSFLR